MYSIIEIPNGKISYYSVGNGKPLILLTGFSGTFLHWDKEFIQTLQEKYTLYCLNYRGVGYSVVKGNELSIKVLSEDVFHFINALNLQKVSLLGYSMGGYIAQEFAFHYSHRLSALHLIATRTAGTKHVPASKEVAQRLVPRTMTFEERIQERLDLNFPPEYHAKMKPIQEAWVEHYALPECALDLDMLNRQRTAIVEWQKNFSEEKYLEFQKINVPTHIFCGLKDLIVPYQNSLVLCELIPKSMLTIFEDGGHGLLSQFGGKIGKLIWNS